MTPNQQFNLFVDAIGRAIDDTLDDIPGTVIDPDALYAALSCVVFDIAMAEDEPAEALSRFLAKTAHTFSALLESRTED